jgi:hypothetical protein
MNQVLWNFPFIAYHVSAFAISMMIITLIRSFFTNWGFYGLAIWILMRITLHPGSSFKGITIFLVDGDDMR